MARTESWLREKQAGRAGEVLVITGRGNQSEGGVSVVREGVMHLLSLLRRRGVVAEVAEHTPGSFVVKLAPLSALRDAPRRRRDPELPRPADPRSLAGLSEETRALLREVSLHALEELGVQEPRPFLRAEMLAQLSHAVAALPDGADREARLRSVLAALLAEYDER